MRPFYIPTSKKRNKTFLTFYSLLLTINHWFVCTRACVFILSFSIEPFLSLRSEFWAQIPGFVVSNDFLRILRTLKNKFCYFLPIIRVVVRSHCVHSSAVRRERCLCVHIQRVSLSLFLSIFQSISFQRFLRTFQHRQIVIESACRECQNK